MAETAIVIGKKRYTHEELIAIQEQRIADANTEYIKHLKISLKTIKELDPKDRLDLAHAIWVIVECMKASIKGWDTWLNLRSMKFLSEEDLKKVVPILQKAALKWIQVDVDITQLKTDELLAKIKKKTTKKKPKKKRSKNIYVA